MGLPKWRAHAWIYYIAVVVTGLGVIGVNAHALATEPAGDLTWLFLIVPIAVMARLYVQVPGQTGRICPSGVFTLYSAVVFGPEETVVLALLEAVIVGWDQTAQVYTRLLYNATAIPLAAWLGAMVAQWLGGLPILAGTASVVILQAAAAAVIYFLANLSLILGIMLFTAGLKVLPAIKGILLWSWAPYAIGGVTAGILGLIDPTGSPLGVGIAAAVLYLTWRCLDYYFSALTEKKEALAEKADALAANEELLRQKEDLLVEVRETHMASLKTLATAIEAKDPHTHGHGQRVEALMGVLSQALSLPEEEREALAIAALLHDVGKLGVPEYLLYPNRKLGIEDQEKLQSHARIGAEILSNARLSPVVTQVIRHHHERWDGTGYPDGLAGEAIPQGARLLTLADTWDRLRHPVSGIGVSLVDALSKLRSDAGRSLDPTLVALAMVDGGALLSAAETRGVGFFERGGAGPSVAQNVIEDLQRHHRETRAIFDLGEKLRATMKLTEVLKVVTQAMMDLAPSRAALVFLPAGDEARLELAHIEGPSPLNPGTFQEERWSALLLDCDDASRVSPDLSPHALGLGRPEDALNARPHIFPMELSRTARGFVVLWSDVKGPFAPDALGLRGAASLAAQAAPVIYNARSYDRIQRESTTDALTGMANGRVLRREGEQIIRDAFAEGRSGVVVMMDLNGFKAINDILGHGEGDRLLVEIARLLGRSTHRGELAVRNGGDEFVLVWPGVTSGEARARLDAIFEEACTFWPDPWDHAKGTSAGIATFPQDGRLLERLMSAADERMYLDKKAKKVRRFTG